MIEQQAPTLEQMFGVGERAQQIWFTRAEAAWVSLKGMTELIMHRKLRAEAERFCKDVSAVIRNCHSDPNDIRVEPALPMLIEKINKLLDDYFRTAAMESFAEPPSEKLKAALRLLGEGHQAFTNLLGKMKSNDTEDFTLRTDLMSAVFERFPKPPQREA